MFPRPVLGLLVLLGGCSVSDARFHARMGRASAVQETFMSGYRAALAAGQPAEVAKLVGSEHDPDCPPPVVDDHVRKLLGPLKRVARAHAAVSKFRQVGARVLVELEVRLDGPGHGGERVTVRARCNLELALELALEPAEAPGEEAGSWVIVRHGPFASEIESRPVPTYIDATADLGAGYDQRHPPFDQTNKLMSSLWPGCGLAVIDADGDGLEDLFLVDGKQSRLLMNRGPGKAMAEVGVAAGVASSIGTGVCVADVDGDGWPDILMTHAFDGLRLLRHRGLGTDGLPRFLDVTKSSGLQREPRPSSVAFADVDADGDLDLYVCNSGDYYAVVPDPVWAARNGYPDALYLNRGDGTFSKAGPESGVGCIGWGLACGFADIDADGLPDIYIANDFGYNQLLWNRGGGRFLDVTREAGVGDSGYGMGVAWGDADGDGDLDLAISNISSPYGWIYTDPDMPLPFLGRIFRPMVQGWLTKELRGNTLLLNETKPGGRPAFVDVSVASGTALGGWSWGLRWLDYDLDGDLDLFAPNGCVPGQGPDREFDWWLDTVLRWPDYVAGLHRYVRGEAGLHGSELNCLFRNDGPREAGGIPVFKEVAYQEGVANEVCARAVAICDLDQNGAPDLVLRNYEAPAQILLHRGPHKRHWLALRLRGKAPNTGAIGARVVLTAGGRSQLREVEAGGGYLSSSCLTLLFGLGDQEVVDEVRIRWPSGASQRLGPMAADRLVTVMEGAAIEAGGSSAPRPRTGR